MHTRYAPVRRSPAVYCYTPLPLDLHVLGLPLAFILSQDQTLHCKNCLLLPFDSSRVSRYRPDRPAQRHTLSHLPHPFQCPVASRNRHSFAAAPLSKAGAKIQPFSESPNFFFEFFHRPSAPPLYASAIHTKKKFKKRRPEPEKTPQNGKKGPRIRKIGHPPRQKNHTIAAMHCKFDRYIILERQSI